ncbi:3-deoxy-7-phosphoheptulonate synthase [Candidatus Pacearchaeota archaeon]|nr:3-deoxy-7-phosphoheptulonate synthase [Candidatus Pacearchaeota archaeon]
MKFDKFTIIAGPCAVESEEQVISTAKFLIDKGIKIMRGGAYKPRTSPEDFQGLKEKGLEILQKAKNETGIQIITEVLDPRDVEKVSAVADILQIGARNMQNFVLLTEAGKTKMPVMLKRGMSATMDEWIKAAKYIEKEGGQVIFCERGIRTFETKTRNTLDISTVPIIKSETNSLIFIDPSHAAGRKDLIIPLSKAAKAIGADGIIVEIHPNPDKALCDGKQSLTFSEFENLLKELK